MASLTWPVTTSKPSHFNPYQGPKSNDDNIFSSLKSPKSTSQLRVLHARVIKTGLANNDYVIGQLLFCCSISGCMLYAQNVFDKIPHRKLFFYNAMIKCYSDNRAYKDVLRLYSLMRIHSVACDSFTFPGVLRSASSLANVAVGAEVHGLAMKTGFDSKITVKTTLIDMYCNCGLSGQAWQIFDRMSEKDVICWNTMIAGYVKCGEFTSARELFDLMPVRNVSSWNTIVDMYCKSGDVEAANVLFNEMPEKDIISWNAIISGYAKVGQVEVARRLFDEMPQRNVVSWNVMMTCYVHNRQFHETLELFKLMQVSDVKPNEVTAVVVLPACAHLGALDMGKWVHAFIGKHRIKMDAYVTTALIDMYGKCGSIEYARKVFDDANEKDSFMCGTMIEVAAIHGKAEEAFEIFHYMRRAKIKPSDITFVGLLKACSHVGMVDAGKRYFNLMSEEFGLAPKLEHFGCMVDLLGRAGFLDEAQELIMSMPMDPHPVIWGALLSACRLHGHTMLAKEVAFHLMELEPESCGNYVLLSNIYSKAGQWEEAVKIRTLMKEKRVKKYPGCSSIELNNRVCEFFAGDRFHPQCKQVYEMVDQMVTTLKKEGYAPLTSSALHDVDEEGKQRSLTHHSEKLAVAFGFISTETRSPIRVVKNLRICDDCHLFLKMTSRYYEREIIVRDCNRFHHFREGVCSCSDYW
ncbi:pentatricopeptide repeat-containing protein At1g08070, chloroplastic-like [Aristolochia californica]|uniref:pentatricopeptide repeat-containing protein At1g08070, chloroplastic-like n=1 Tax=Aristolochia californica TaxID=171875 RepID=UPI0035DCD6B7